MKTKTYYTAQDIKEDYHGHFFGRTTMRFFNSRILSAVYQGPGGIFFVTSERFDELPRHYTVRRFFPDQNDIIPVELLLK